MDDVSQTPKTPVRSRRDRNRYRNDPELAPQTNPPTREVEPMIPEEHTALLDSQRALCEMWDRLQRAETAALSIRVAFPESENPVAELLMLSNRLRLLENFKSDLFRLQDWIRFRLEQNPELEPELSQMSVCDKVLRLIHLLEVAYAETSASLVEEKSRVAILENKLELVETQVQTRASDFQALMEEEQTRYQMLQQQLRHAEIEAQTRLQTREAELENLLKAEIARFELFQKQRQLADLETQKRLETLNANFESVLNEERARFQGLQEQYQLDSAAARNYITIMQTSAASRKKNPGHKRKRVGAKKLKRRRSGLVSKIRVSSKLWNLARPLLDRNARLVALLAESETKLLRTGESVESLQQKFEEAQRDTSSLENQMKSLRLELQDTHSRANELWQMLSDGEAEWAKFADAVEPGSASSTNLTKRERATHGREIVKRTNLKMSEMRAEIIASHEATVEALENVQALRKVNEELVEKFKKTQHAQTTLRTELAQDHERELEIYQRELAKCERERTRWRDLAEIAHVDGTTKSNDVKNIGERWGLLIVEHESADLVTGIPFDRPSRTKQIFEALDSLQRQNPDIVDKSMRNALSRVLLSHCLRDGQLALKLDAQISAFERGTNQVYKFGLKLPAYSPIPPEFSSPSQVRTDSFSER